MRRETGAVHINDNDMIYLFTDTDMLWLITGCFR